VQIDDYQLAEQLLFSHLLCCAFYPKQSVIQYYRYYFYIFMSHFTLGNEKQIQRIRESF